MEKMNEFWSLNEGTFYCLYDKPRTIAFKKAIENTVKEGDVVVELGAGSGVLSMFAADAGAKKVYAIELDKMNLNSLKQTIKLNGYENTIEVIEGDATTIDLPEKPDVIICELIATGLIEELQIPAMNNALRFAHENTKVLLHKYQITAELVSEKNTFYEKQFHVVRYEFPDLRDLKSKVISNTHTVRTVDFSNINENTFLQESFTLTAKRSGVINGLRIGGNTIFADGSTFGNSISYSFPAILPVLNLSAKKGDEFEISLSYSMCEGPHKLDYRVQKL